MWVHTLSKESILLWVQITKCFVWLLNHYIFLNYIFQYKKRDVWSQIFFFFFNVKSVNSCLVEGEWQKMWQTNEKNIIYRISNVWESSIRPSRVSSFFSSKLIESCTKLECTSVVWDYAEFTNLTVFGPKVVQPEMKTNVNIGNSFWTVIRHYPWYINDCNSHFWISSLFKTFYETLKLLKAFSKIYIFSI